MLGRQNGEILDRRREPCSEVSDRVSLQKNGTDDNKGEKEYKVEPLCGAVRVPIIMQLSSGQEDAKFRLHTPASPEQGSKAILGQTRGFHKPFLYIYQYLPVHKTFDL